MSSVGSSSLRKWVMDQSDIGRLLCWSDRHHQNNCKKQTFLWNLTKETIKEYHIKNGHIATLEQKLNHSCQMVSVEMFTANLVGRWSELSLMVNWEERELKRAEGKWRKVKTPLTKSMKKESQDRPFVYEAGMKKTGSQNKEMMFQF